MTNYYSHELTSLIDTKYSNLDEIHNSINTDFVPVTSGLSIREKRIIERRNVRLNSFKNLAKAVVFNQISAIYIVGRKFRAGIYKEELESDLFLDDDGKWRNSAYYFKEHDTTSEIKKFSEPNTPRNKAFLALVIEHIEEIAELGGLPKIQLLIDKAKAHIAILETESASNKSEKEKRKIFDGLLSTELIRSINNWSSLREVAAREIMHTSFREKVENLLEESEWISSIEEESIMKNSKVNYKIYWGIQGHTIDLYDYQKPFSDLTDEEYKKIDQIVGKMKKFDEFILGYDKEYLIRKQEIQDNSTKKEARKFNAPNNFSTETLKDKIFPFLFKDEKLKLSLNQIFMILQKSIEQYIGTLQLSKSFEVADDIRADQSQESNNTSLIDEHSIDLQQYDAERDLIRNDLLEAIKSLDINDQKLVTFVIGLIKLLETILQFKESVELEFDKDELDIIKDAKINIFYKNIKFFPIKLNMTRNKIKQEIFQNIAINWFEIDTTYEKSLENSKKILSELMSSIDHDSAEIDIYHTEALDIFHENFQNIVSIEYPDFHKILEESENE